MGWRLQTQHSNKAQKLQLHERVMLECYNINVIMTMNKRGSFHIT